MDAQETLHTIALTKLGKLSLLNQHVLMQKYGSAQEVFAHTKDILKSGKVTDRVKTAFAHAEEALHEAEQEMDVLTQKNITPLVLNAEDYPQRLKECPDAPLVLYLCGNINLNTSRFITIIGTRKCTEYGRELCSNFVANLKQYVPDAVIVSGLAYGIDICAHRAALDNGMPTVGVLAHGLDMIYPTVHRGTASQMVHSGGGLLTEFPLDTKLERHQFVQRNRIVAGMSDACVVVESSSKGGSLITAGLAFDYNRDVFAFPGRVYDNESAGCHHLITKQKATLITSAEDFVEAMGWSSLPQKENNLKAIQQELFPNLNEEEQLIVNVLKQTEDKHVNQLVIETNIPYSRTVMVLFDLEMKGVVKELGGARYRLVRK